MHAQLGKILDKRYKQKKKQQQQPNVIFEEPEAKAGYCVYPLHTTT